MEIEINWSSPKPLQNGAKENLIYTIDLDSIPDEPGLYFFAREHGETASFLHICQALNLQRRLNSTLLKFNLLY